MAKYRRNNLSGFAVVGVVFLVAIAIVGALLFGSWALMLILGFVHLHVLAAVSPIGFTNSVILQLLFDMWAFLSVVSKTVVNNRSK